MRKLRVSLLGLLFLVFSSSGSAQSSTLRTVGFGEVLARAREAPPTVLVAMAALARAEAEAGYARGGYIPRLTLEAGAGVTYDNHAALPNNLPPAQTAGIPGRIDSTAQSNYGRVTVDYALLDLARRGAVLVAQKSVTVRTHARDASIRLAQQAAAHLYLRSVAAVELVADARLTLERRAQQQEAIRGLVRAGLRPSVDATRAEIEALAARYALETREIEREASFAALASALAIDPTRPVQPAPFDDGVLPAPLGPARASEQALAQRPEVQESLAARVLRSAEHRAALGARLPTLGVLGSGNANYAEIWSGTGIEGSSYYANGAVYLRWSALDPTVWRRGHVTRAAIVEAERALDATVLAVRTEVVEAAYEVQRTRALLSQATQVLAATQAARTAQNERYRAGVASLLELLDAEAIEQNARRQRIEAERDHRIARTRLLASCGALGALAR